MKILTRISHQLSTAAGEMPVISGVLNPQRLNRASAMAHLLGPAVARTFWHLTHLATKSGKKCWLIICCVSLFFISSGIQAGTFTEDFSTLDRFSTSSAVWNIVSSKVHLPFAVTTPSRTGKNFPLNQRTVVPTSGLFPIGTGSDGVFDSTTYSTFDLNNGSTPGTVTLDTTRTYEFTTFTLDNGYTLTASGSSPLQLRVLGNVTINGVIDLNGENGGTINSDTSSTPSGGISIAGGGTGGNGGTTAQEAIDGTPGNSLGTGKGLRGSQGGTAGGGGGGGGYAQAGGNGETMPGGGAGGVGGASYGEPEINDLPGGSGGGGGAPFLTGDSTTNSSGAGGGGGGGALYLTAGGLLQVSSTGQILSVGGNGGGTTNNVLKAGAGGGGAGGSIVLFAGGLISNSGVIRAKPGTQGESVVGGDGGRGKDGRIRIVCNADFWENVGGDEDPVPPFADFGKSVYSANTNYTVISSGIDTQNSGPTNFAITPEAVVPAGTAVTYELAGSSDNFESDDTGWVPSTNLSSLDGKRYFKFRLTLFSTDQTKTPEITSLTITYTEMTQQTFNFTLAGCARAFPSASPSVLLSLLVFFIWLSALMKSGRFMLRAHAKITSRFGIASWGYL